MELNVTSWGYNNASVGELTLEVSNVSYVAVLLGVVIVVGNAITLLTIKLTPSFRTTTDMYLASLTTADLLIGVVIMWSIVLNTSNELFDRSGMVFKYVCLSLQCVAGTVGMASVSNLALVSLDRCMAVSYPFFYRSHVVRSRTWMAIVSCWSCCFLYGLLIIVRNRYSTKVKCHFYLLAEVWYIRYVTPFLVIAFIALSVICYIKIALVFLESKQNFMPSIASLKKNRIKKSDITPKQPTYKVLTTIDVKPSLGLANRSKKHSKRLKPFSKHLSALHHRSVKLKAVLALERSRNLFKKDLQDAHRCHPAKTQPRTRSNEDLKLNKSLSGHSGFVRKSLSTSSLPDLPCLLCLSPSIAFNKSDPTLSNAKRILEVNTIDKTYNIEQERYLNASSYSVKIETSIDKIEWPNISAEKQVYHTNVKKSFTESEISRFLLDPTEKHSNVEQYFKGCPADINNCYCRQKLLQSKFSIPNSQKQLQLDFHLDKNNKESFPESRQTHKYKSMKHLFVLNENDVRLGKCPVLEFHYNSGIKLAADKPFISLPNLFEKTFLITNVLKRAYLTQAVLSPSYSPLPFPDLNSSSNIHHMPSNHNVYSLLDPTLHKKESDECFLPLKNLTLTRSDISSDNLIHPFSEPIPSPVSLDKKEVLSGRKCAPSNSCLQSSLGNVEKHSRCKRCRYDVHKAILKVAKTELSTHGHGTRIYKSYSSQGLQYLNNIRVNAKEKQLLGLNPDLIHSSHSTLSISSLYRVRSEPTIARKAIAKEMSKNSRHAINIIFVTQIIFIVCMLPTTVIFICHGLVDIPIWLYKLSTTLTSLNSLANIFVYAGYSVKYRAAIWSVIRCRFLK
ncbi:octopamine receptor beta-2R [Biomphalaria glabrata]|nr:octopamine receptor beta-2R [Biomphalaria glabrata]